VTGYPFTISFPLQWGEMDALGHVNNTRYFAWFESARIQLVDRVGALRGRPGPGGGEVGPILAHTSCDYLKPMVYPADVLVGVRVGKIGNTSVEMEYAAARADAPEQHFARGRSVIVMVRYATAEKIPISPELRAALAAFAPPSGT
jgi:acyl-CoA thioester hydrolase